jgi:predicted deacylase
LDTSIISTIDIDSAGRHFGLLRVPESTNEGGWGSLDVPVAAFINGTGPTALVMGGNHGDEPEGMIACYDLIHRIHLSDVHGRLIVIPCLSPDAARGNTRLWPSGANLNRSFPGSASGAPHEQLADYLSRYLIPMADTVVDMHAGGRSGVCLPWSEMHPVDDRDQRKRMVEAMLAWNSDWHFIYIDIAGSGLLAGEAERQGKTHVSTELRGGGTILRDSLDIARDGLMNVLRQQGVLRGQVETRASIGKPPATILRAIDRADYLPSPESGYFEPLVRLGESVSEGQRVGLIHFLERPDRTPEPIIAQTAGIVCSHRAIFRTRQGDCVVVVGQPVTLEEALS